MDLVEEFMKHCINRYGLQEVETWYFEVWNEPEYEYVLGQIVRKSILNSIEKLHWLLSQYQKT